MKFFTSFFVCGALAMDSTLMMLLMQNGMQNPNQASQMNMMIPLLLLDDGDSKSSENTNMLMLMMIQGP